MRRLATLLTLSCALIAVPVMAASPPSGTITCGLAGALDFRPGLPTLPNPEPPLKIGAKIKNATGVCDGSGVVGGRAPIDGVTVALSGRLPIGATCADLVSTPSFERTKIKVRWRSAGRLVATSSTTVASASYDGGTDQIVLVTAPVARGAFAGSTVTLRLGITNPPEYDRLCTTVDALFGGLYFGTDSPASVEVP